MYSRLKQGAWFWPSWKILNRNWTQRWVAHRTNETTTTTKQKESHEKLKTKTSNGTDSELEAETEFSRFIIIESLEEIPPANMPLILMGKNINRSNP